MQHPVVTSLLEEGLTSSSPSHVTSCSTVLVTACVLHGWLAHQDLLSALVARAGVVPTYGPVLEGVTRLLLVEMAAIVEECSVYISPYSLK